MRMCMDAHGDSLILQWRIPYPMIRVPIGSHDSVSNVGSGNTGIQCNGIPASVSKFDTLAWMQSMRVYRTQCRWGHLYSTCATQYYHCYHYSMSGCHPVVTGILFRSPPNTLVVTSGTMIVLIQAYPADKPHWLGRFSTQPCHAIPVAWHSIPANENDWIYLSVSLLSKCSALSE